MKKIFLTILFLMFGVSNQTQPFFSMDSMFDVTSWLIPQNLYVPTVTLSDVLTGTVQAVGRSLQGPKTGWFCAAAVVGVAGVGALWYKSKKDAEINRLKKEIDKKLHENIKELEEKLQKINSEVEAEVFFNEVSKSHMINCNKQLEVDLQKKQLKIEELNETVNDLKNEISLSYKLMVGEFIYINNLRGFLPLASREDSIKNLMSKISKIDDFLKTASENEKEEELKRLKLAFTGVEQLKADMARCLNNMKDKLKAANQKIRELEAQLEGYTKEEQ